MEHLKKFHPQTPSPNEEKLQTQQEGILEIITY